MTCTHAETFDCHGTKRCSTCHLDSYLLHDGTRFWPAQEHPDEWDDSRVAHWFFDNQIYRLPQGCEGFTFCRKPNSYGYIWVEVVLDLDYQMAYMLDVRRHDGTDEHRQFILVLVGAFASRDLIIVATHPTGTWGNDDLARLTDALHWFADQVDAWLRTGVSSPA